jgi:DNA-binding transcriptional ArsR family regulator
MPLDEHTSLHLANLFSALSDPARLCIIEILLEGEQSVGAIAEQLGMSESAVSHQLRGLRLQRIVRARKQAKQPPENSIILA